MSNNGKSADVTTDLERGSNVATAADHLRSFVSRIERLQDDKDAATADMAVVYAEAKSEGFDTKILRKVIARRKKGADVATEEDQLIEAYEAALGGTQLVLPIERAEAAAAQ